MSEKQIYSDGYRTLVASLKDTRKRLGLTQAEVACRMNLGRTWVVKVEACEIGLDLLHLVQMCRVYGLKAQDMIELMQ
jgi:transcriptional regulator with XRE-family HTH domain